MGPHVAWIFVALLLGLCIGWLTYARHRARMIDALVWIVIGLLIVSPVLLPDLSAAATPLGTLLALFYFIGCPIGWWLRRDAWAVRSEAERHAEGYVFRGGRRAEATRWWPVLQRSNGTSTAVHARPAASSPAPTVSKPASFAPIVPSQPVAEAAVASAAVAKQPPAPLASPSPPPTDELSQVSNEAPIAAAPAMQTGPTATPPATAEKSGLSASVENRVVGASPSPASQAEATDSTVTASTPGTDTTHPSPEPAAAPAVSDPPASPPVPDQDKHSGVRPPGFVTARADKPDNLQWIRGIGPQNEERLHRLGIWHFDQIGAWTIDEVRWVGSYLAFPGRIDRERWVEQARDIAAGAITPKATARRPVRPHP